MPSVVIFHATFDLGKKYKKNRQSNLLGRLHQWLDTDQVPIYSPYVIAAQVFSIVERYVLRPLLSLTLTKIHQHYILINSTGTTPCVY